MRAAIIFTLFSVFEWTGENGSNTLRVDAYFLKNGRQNSPFSKIFGYLWTGPKPTVFFAVLLTSPASLLKVPTIVSAYYKLLIITKVRVMDKYTHIYTSPSTF